VASRDLFLAGLLVKMSAPDDDQEFYETSFQGDRYEEFLSLFSQHRDRIFAHIFCLVPHEADAEDIFQRCSVVLWRKFSVFESSGSFHAWACGVATNEVRNFFKGQRRSRVRFFPEAIDLLAEEQLAREDEFAARALALQACLERLRPEDRNLLRIAYWENRSLKEFAESTQHSLQVIYNRLSKIRKLLFQCIERKIAQERRHD